MENGIKRIISCIVLLLFLWGMLMVSEDTVMYSNDKNLNGNSKFFNELLSDLDNGIGKVENGNSCSSSNSTELEEGMDKILSNSVYYEDFSLDGGIQRVLSSEYNTLFSLDTGIVSYEGDVDINVVNSVFAFYSKVPETIRTSMENEGYKILVTEDDFGSKYGYTKDIQALIDYDLKVIYVSNKFSAASSVVHEIGHYVDKYFLFKGYQSEFTLIWLEELNSFKDITNVHEDNYNTSGEYFAESFSSCLLQPEVMEEACPKTYNYIMVLINNMQ